MKQFQRCQIMLDLDFGRKKKQARKRSYNQAFWPFNLLTHWSFDPLTLWPFDFKKIFLPFYPFTLLTFYSFIHDLTILLRIRLSPWGILLTQVRDELPCLLCICHCIFTSSTSWSGWSSEKCATHSQTDTHTDGATWRTRSHYVSLVEN